VSDVLCDIRVPLKLKGTLYWIVVKPTMLFETECGDEDVALDVW
jgi:hypothetical protein